MGLCISSPQRISPHDSEGECINIICPPEKTGSYGCMYRFEKNVIDLLIKLVYNGELVLTYYYSDNGKITPGLFYPTEGNKVYLHEILKTGIKVFYNLERAKDIFNSEIENIENVFNIYDNEIEKYTTYKNITLGTSYKLLGFSFRVTSSNLTIRLGKNNELITNENNYEVFFIPQHECLYDMIRFISHIPRASSKERIDAILSSFIDNILESLKIMFEKGYVHRDIKPENIVYCVNEPIRFKLIDFGFLHPAGEQYYMDEIVGTPAFISPLLWRTYHSNGKLTNEHILNIHIIDNLNLNRLGPYHPFMYNLDIFKGTQFQELRKNNKIDYHTDLFALYITFKEIGLGLYNDKNPLTKKQLLDKLIIGKLTKFVRSLSLPPTITKGGSSIIRKVDGKKIHILGRERCVYVGKYGKQYIKLKNKYVEVSSIKKNKIVSPS